MACFTVIAVGKGPQNDIVRKAIGDSELIVPNDPIIGRLGNFSTYVYDLYLKDSDVIEARKDLYNRLMDHRDILTVLVPLDDDMCAYVFNADSHKKHTLY